MSFPRMLRIRQHFDAPIIEDIPEAIRQEVTRMKLDQKIKPGENVAISVGSRGINNIALITKCLVEEFKSL